MVHLRNLELENRRDIFILIKVKESKDECDLLAFSRMVQDRRCFIAAGLSMDEGRNMTRKRLRKMEDVITWNDPTHVGIYARQKKAVEKCCNCSSKIDQFNMHLQ